MNLEEQLSTASKQEALAMALEIIEIELYAQFLVIGISPESFDKESNVTLSDLGVIPEKISQAENYAYTAIPRLIDRRAAIIVKLNEENNAGA